MLKKLFWDNDEKALRILQTQVGTETNHLLTRMNVYFPTEIEQDVKVFFPLFYPRFYHSFSIFHFSRYHKFSKLYSSKSLFLFLISSSQVKNVSGRALSYFP